MNIKIPFIAFLILASLTAGYAQTLDKARLDAFFDRLAEKKQAMGSLVIAKDGKVLYSRAIGYSQINGAERKPLTPANRFRIASIAKTYTAIMVMQLVEEQKLKPTDTLDRFFPQIPNAKRITILQMLSHRSGIPNVQRDWDPQRNWRNGITKNEMFDLIAKATPEFEPDIEAVLQQFWVFSFSSHPGKDNWPIVRRCPRSKNYLKDWTSGYLQPSWIHRCE